MSEVTKETSNVKLWNPNAAANWSILFTPIFGAWLHAKNWTALNEPDKAKKSMYWVYACAAFILASTFLPIQLPRSIGLVVLIVWYFTMARKQVKHVKENNISYEKEGFLKPIGIAIGAFLAFIFVIVVVAFGQGVVQGMLES